MKNKKNLFVILMVIVIVAGMLAAVGCGEDNNSGGNKEKTIDPATLAADVVMYITHSQRAQTGFRIKRAVNFLMRLRFLLQPMRRTPRRILRV